MVYPEYEVCRIVRFGFPDATRYRSVGRLNLDAEGMALDTESQHATEFQKETAEAPEKSGG
jgi:hypothetical protein